MLSTALESGCNSLKQLLYFDGNTSDRWIGISRIYDQVSEEIKNKTTPEGAQGL